MKIFISIIFVATVFVYSCDKGAKTKHPQWLEEDVFISTTNDTIFGTLLKPIKIQDSVVAIIIAGSGPTDRNGNQPTMVNNSLRFLAEALANRGIPSIRYDKRCIGKSKCTIPESELRIETYADDAVRWIDWAHNQHFSKIVLIGHSEGSLIAILAAQKQTVSGLISIAGISKSADEILIEQLKSLPENLFNEAKQHIDDLKNNNPISQVSPQLMSLFRPSVQPYLKSWFRYNPSLEIGKLSIPIFILQGSHDIQVDTLEAYNLAKSALNAQLKIISGMNHILKQSPKERSENIKTYIHPTLPIDSTLVESTVEFILNSCR
ncbi:MAG TPA: alpha/beta hydrolase [Salinivirgaceae bacterium]|nr:alpha/beta hydrolase [Salinivirgaceae bacterium]